MGWGYSTYYIEALEGSTQKQIEYKERTSKTSDTAATGTTPATGCVLGLTGVSMPLPAVSAAKKRGVKEMPSLAKTSQRLQQLCLALSAARFRSSKFISGKNAAAAAAATSGSATADVPSTVAATSDSAAATPFAGAVASPAGTKLTAPTSDEAEGPSGSTSTKRET